MAIPVSSSARTNAGGSAQLRISEPSTANRKTSTRRSKSTASARASSQLLPLCAHPSLRSITNKLTAIQTSRTDTRYSSASQSANITSETSGNIGNGSGYNSNAALPIQTPKVPKPRPKLSDIPPAHRAVWGKFVKGKVPVPGKVKHEKLCGRCGEKNHGHGNGSGPFGDAFRAVEPAGSKDGRAGGEGPYGPSGKNLNQNIITTTTTKTTSKPGNPKMTTTTSVTTTSAPPSSATPAPLPIQLYAPDCVLFDDPSALDDFRPRYTRPGPAPPPPMMNGRRRAPRRHDHSNNSQYNSNTSAPSHNHTHIHCNCAAKRSTDPQLIASIQAYIHTLFTLKYTYHDLPHAFFDKVREAEKGLIPLLLRDGVVDVARRRGDLGEAAKKQKSGNAKRQVVVAGKSSQPEKRYSQSKEPTSVATMPSGDSSRPVISPPGTSSLSRTGSQESQSSNSTQDTTDSKSLAKGDRASAQQQPGKPSATPTRPDLSLNLKLDDFPTPEMMFDMREEMRDVVGDFLSEIFITTATDISDHIALLADIHGYDSLSCGPPCVCTLSACLPCIINLQFRLINDEPVKPFPRDPPDTALVRWSVKAIRGSMISTEAIIGEPKKLAKAIQKPANDTSRASKSANGKDDDAPYVPIEEIMRQIDASDERDRLQLEEAQRRMGDELWRIALEMDLEVLAKREIRALKEVPDDEFVTLLNEACSPNPEDEHEEEHRLIDLWEEWTGHIPSIDPDHTHSEEKDYLEAEKEKKSGNHAFTRGLYRRALRHFTRAIELDPDQSVYPLNRAAAYLKLERWERAQKDCTTCITLDPRNSKAYYRRALARKAMGYLFDAERDLQAVLALEPKSTAFHVELRDIQELIAHTAETSNSSRMTALPSIPKVEDSKEAKADRNANEVKLKQRFDRTVKEKFADIASRPSKKDAVSRQRSNSSTDNLCDMHQFEACLKYGLPEPTCPCGEDHDWEDEDTDGSYYDYDDDEGSEDYSDIEQAAAAAVEEAKRRINGVPNAKGITDDAANKLLRDSIMPSGTSVNISDEVNTRMQAALKNPGLDSFDQLKQCFADSIFAAMTKHQEQQGA